MARPAFGKAIITATAFCGTLDIVFAFVMASLRGTTPAQVLQYVSSGLLGRTAFQLGWHSAALGLMLHYAMMLVICAIFIAASRRISALNQHWLVFGILYGLTVYVVMSHIVIPLSAIGPVPFRWPGSLPQIAAMVLLVGLPTAWVARRARI